MAGARFFAQIPNGSAAWTPQTRATIDLAPAARVLKLPLAGAWVQVDPATLAVGELVLGQPTPAAQWQPVPWPPAP